MVNGSQEIDKNEELHGFFVFVFVAFAEKLG